MRYFELDQEEKAILKELDEGNFVSLGKLASKKYEEYAKATLNKSRNVNIRLSEKDLHKMKSKAVSKGMPYQTLMSSLIHQYVNDQIKVEG